MTPIITQLHLYPIKSCGGIALREATVTASGLTSLGVFDREWMVVDGQGNFLTQRECPRLATVKPTLAQDGLTLHAPDMPDLDISSGLARLDTQPEVEVSVWDDIVKASDCGDIAAKWFSDFLGITCRLVHFHPLALRFASKQWTDGIEAPTRFSDGFPVLVLSEASLDDLNQKLAVQKRDALPMNRFRPNIVIGGTGPFEEDYADSIRIGPALLKPVKPCPRCPVPSINQETGVTGPDPLDILQSYRTSPLVNGAIVFGMNAILLEGDGQLLRVGDACEIELAF